MVCAGEGDEVADVLRLCEAGALDVLLIYSESDPGWKLCLMITSFFPKLTVVALLGTNAENPVAGSWALLHGARGLVGISAEAERLGVVIRGAVEFGHYVDPALEVSLTPAPPQPGKLAGRPLSAREFEVLQLIADGRTADQIGQRLGITTDSARTHIGQILRKLRARDRAHAVAISFENALLPARFTGI
jgi:DNA-binding NarL/FixJ family response regulator